MTRPCPLGSGTTRSPASSARAAWASSTRRATSGWSAPSRSRRCRRSRGDETARKRFWREARAAASVNHPNVCQLYEIGEDEGELFIAMELLEGESLAARLRRGPLSVSETLPIGLGMLAALSALHAAAIIHRDLKPSNVFLTPHGVKLLDFGLARTDRAGAGAIARLGHRPDRAPAW